MNKIFITGGTGFIGRNLISALIKDDDQFYLTVAVRNKNKIIRNKRIKYVFIDDVFNKNEFYWAKKLKDIDTLIHLAWDINSNDYLNSQENIKCLRGSIDIALGAKMAGVKKFYGFGTCFEYKQTNKTLHENSQLSSFNLYSSCKLSLYLILNDIFKNNITSFTWIRIFFLYGEDQPSNKLYPYIKDNIKNKRKIKLSNPNYIRDYLNINTACAYLIAIFKGPYVPLINLSSGKGIKIVDFIKNEFGKRNLDKYIIFLNTEYRKNEPLKVLGSNKILKKILKTKLN